jgi:hypothetical protein
MPNKMGPDGVHYISDAQHVRNIRNVTRSANAAKQPDEYVPLSKGEELKGYGKNPAKMTFIGNLKPKTLEDMRKNSGALVLGETKR